MPESTRLQRRMWPKDTHHPQSSKTDCKFAATKTGWCGRRMNAWPDGTEQSQKQPHTVCAIDCDPVKLL